MADSQWPNLYIVGAVKSGTTSLYAYLKNHPEIFFPEMKEPHFFTHPKPSAEQRHYIRYTATEREYLRLYARAGHYRYRGDASPSYLWAPHAAAEIARYSPHAQILIILRDPVERAYSQYLMDFNEGVIDLPFWDALQRDWQRPDKGWGVSQLYVELGLYSEQIARYFRSFGRDRVQVMLLEHLHTQPLQVLRKISAALQIDPSPFRKVNLQVAHNHYAQPRGNWARRLAAHPVSRTIGEKFFPSQWGEYIWRQIFLRPQKKPLMDPHAKEWLMTIYEPELLRLEELLGRPLPELRRSWSTCSVQSSLAVTAS
ncbi:MAG: sulfotransferase [Acidithiobacillus sp.]|nr:sulfotransferase [Acidithiobacillus sp.]